MQQNLAFLAYAEKWYKNGVLALSLDVARLTPCAVSPAARMRKGVVCSECQFVRGSCVRSSDARRDEGNVLSTLCSHWWLNS
jgi:hypothetical protein